MTLSLATVVQLSAAEGRLRSDLAAARDALDAASGRHRELMRLHRTQGAISDGVLTLQEAQQLHRAAIRRYAAALSRLSDLVTRPGDGATR
jgi:hypothetical protein